MINQNKWGNYLEVKKKRAIWNFENFHKLERGSVTIKQVECSSAGSHGWAKNIKSQSSLDYS